MNDTKKNIQAFLNGYNRAIRKMGTNFDIEDLYPDGMTVGFHMASYVLYDISDSIETKGIKMESEGIKQKLSLLRKILVEDLTVQ